MLPGVRQCLVAGTLLVLLSTSAGFSADQTGSGKAMTAEQWSAILAECVQTVREQNHPDLVVVAYRKGIKLDPRNVQLHSAYMRRMLGLGVLHAAYEPAEILTKLEPRNATAWAIIAYVRARRNELASALEAEVTAASISLADMSVVNNLGQLIAWYENPGEAPKISTTSRAQADELRKQLLDRRKHTDPHREFLRAYQRGRGICMFWATIRRKYDGRVAAAEKAVALAQKNLEAIDSATGKASSQRGEKSLDLAELKRKLAGIEKRLASLKKRRDVDRNLRDDLARERRKLNDEAAPLRKAIAELATQDKRAGKRVKSTSDRAASARGVLKERKEHLASLLKKRQEEMESHERQWLWLAPRLDGKPVNVVASLPNSKLIPAWGDEAKAARQFEMACLYMDNSAWQQARVLLDQIISSYGATKAAQQAKAMLPRVPRSQ